MALRRARASAVLVLLDRLEAQHLGFDGGGQHGTGSCEQYASGPSGQNSSGFCGQHGSAFWRNSDSGGKYDSGFGFCE